jgi:hypothetical protein
MDAGDPLLLSFHGTAAAYNKSLRKELLGMRSKRDAFLQSRRKILNPFLIEKVRASSSDQLALHTIDGPSNIPFPLLLFHS